MRTVNSWDDYFGLPTLYQCRRCWGEQHVAAGEDRPRCRHCNILMIIKDNPTDEVPLLDRLVDELAHSGPPAASPEAAHHDAARRDAVGEGDVG